MNFLARLAFVLKEGFLQMVRSRGLTTAVIVIVASTLLQLSLFLGLSRVFDRALGTAREKFEMAVFFTPQTNAQDRKRVLGILSEDPRVASVKEITKEEALEDFRKDPEIDRMLRALGENPLNDSFSVVLRNDATENLDSLVDRLRQDPRVEEVDYGKREWEAVSDLTKAVRWTGALLGGVVFLTALFIVSNALSIALWARREDLVLMSRMGAPQWMRQGPYLWEGTLQGFLGALVVVLFWEAVRHGAGEFIRTTAGPNFLSALPGEDWGSLYLVLLLLGMILGFLGAFLAFQKRWVQEIQS